MFFHGILDFLVCCPALVVCKLLGTRVLLWGHGYSKSEGRVRRGIRNLLGAISSGVICYSEPDRQKIEEVLNKKKCFAAPNAIDDRPIMRAKSFWTARKLEEFCRREKLENRNIVLYVSRIAPANDLEILIRAMQLISPELKAEAIVIGGGDENYIAQLKQLSATCDVDSCVRFVGPIYDEVQLAPYFLAAKVFCYPSNIGLSLMHAFNYGLPVVIGDDLSKCNPEVYAFAEGENGLTYSDGDPSSLAETLQELFSDDETRNRLAENSYDTIKNEANLEIMAKGFLEALEETCKGK